MSVCCIPQQNPWLYPFTHRLIHKMRVHFLDLLTLQTIFQGQKRGQNLKRKIRERCANVFVTISPQNEDAP
ncbi:hypothetical protein D3F83_22410 [Salmonella enterica]|uniref:Uncharacterized protein n=1 Tax=Salmonella enterica TaxID=28901 RepID=A0A5U1Q9J4_SALER|nr:hypothetical protein [Salmonella enterica]